MKHIVLFISLLIISHPLSAQVFIPPKKVKPASSGNSGKSSNSPASSSTYRKPDYVKPKLSENLLLSTDSACVVTLTGIKTYTFSLKNNDKRKVLVDESKYDIEAIPINKVLLPIKNTVRTVGDQLEVFRMEFKRRPMDNYAGQGGGAQTQSRLEPRYKDNLVEEISNNMVLVEGGIFLMGDQFNTNKYEPAHTVKLSSFYVSRYEITHRQFVHFLTKTGYVTQPQKNDGAYVVSGEKRKEVNFAYDAQGKIRTSENTNDPVLYVSWNDAVAFCNWLSEETNRKFRLPTEAEWEYSARGGNKSQNLTFAGVGKAEEVAWYAINSGQQTHQVGLKKPNELGLYDMSGNVWEWCADWFDEKYYKNSPTESPAGPTEGSEKVIRGGGWQSDVEQIRIVFRTHKKSKSFKAAAKPNEGYYSIGFRVVTSNP